MLSTKDAALKLGVSIAKIRNLIAVGSIVAVKVGAKYMMTQEAVDAVRRPPNQRTIVEKAGAEWVSIKNITARCSRLCDFGITRFWDENTKALSNSMALTPGADSTYIRNSGVNISNTRLEEKNINLDGMLCTEPCMEYAQNDIKSKTEQLRPRAKLARLWKIWMSEATDVYNFTLGHLSANYADKRMSKYTVRSEVKEAIKICSLPNTSMEYAIFEAILAFKAGDAKKRTESPLSIDGRCIKKGYVYPKNTKKYLKSIYNDRHAQIMQEIKISRFETWNITSICKLLYDPLKRKFSINYAVPVEPKNTVKKPFISLDPGVRSFLTYFDGTSYGEIGARFINSIGRRFSAIDKLETKINETRAKSRKDALRTASNRIRRKITNKIKDLHYKTINFLGGYETVFLPEFKVKNIASTLNNKSTRELMALSHFTFKLRLINKTSEFGNKIIICNEAYTSKTCTRCGTENTNLGSSKVFTCENCHISHDRDYNGARNIALRALTTGHVAGKYFV